MSKGLALALFTGAGICAWLATQLLAAIPTSKKPHTHPRSHLPPFPNDQHENIHWFIQISDLHISIFWDPERISQFENFCREYVDIIKPEVVLVSGDLTDAKEKNFQGSRQFEWEWKQYQKALNNSGVLEKTVWLDTRGNHDAFAVPSLDHKLNYFRKYGVQGAKYPGSSYIYQHEPGDGSRFSFIAVDSCPLPGPKRPFNFFGVMTQIEVDELESLAQESKDSNMTIWFGHYPTSTVVSPGNALKKVISERGSVYMCGHLHTLAGLVPRMYSSHPSGSLELELGDWKENRMFRVFAVDHDMFSFTDEKYGEWPVVLVTNPKHGQFVMDGMEPAARMANSSHIRLLVFSPGEIERVRIHIDGYKLGDATHVSGPLYVLPWKPGDFAKDIHRIEVMVKDSLGNEKHISQPFSLDNSNIPFDFLRRALLLSDHATTLMVFFFLEFSIFGLALLLIALCKQRIKQALSVQWNNCLAALVYGPLMKLYLVTCNSKIFLCTLAFYIYIAIGPWFVGEILEGEYGAMFAWGLVVRRQYIPGSLTYFYAFFQLLLFNIPLALYLGHCIELSQGDGQEATHTTRRSVRQLLRAALTYLQRHAIFYILVSVQAYFAYSGFYLSYGGIALFLGPVRTFSIPYAFILRHLALKPGNIPASEFVVQNAFKTR